VEKPAVTLQPLCTVFLYFEAQAPRYEMCHLLLGLSVVCENNAERERGVTPQREREEAANFGACFSKAETIRKPFSRDKMSLLRGKCLSQELIRAHVDSPLFSPSSRNDFSGTVEQR
jgi:hypothetical protein